MTPAHEESNRLEQDFPVSYAIYAMARVQRAIATPKLAELGLFPAQEIMLTQLGASDGQSQKALAESLRLSHVTVAKMMARMERAGLVTRQSSAKDRRVTLVHLTEAGREVQQGILDVWAELSVVAGQELDAEEREMFVAVAAKIRRALDAAAREVPAD